MKIFRREYLILSILAVLGLILLGGCKTEHRFIKKTAFKDTNSIVITFAGPVDEAWAKNTANYSIYEKPDPDIKLQIGQVSLSPDKRTVVLTFKEDLNRDQPHILTISEITSE
jgi:electron transport complex protein RnfA